MVPAGFKVKCIGSSHKIIVNKNINSLGILNIKFLCSVTHVLWNNIKGLALLQTLCMCSSNLMNRLLNTCLHCWVDINTERASSVYCTQTSRVSANHCMEAVASTTIKLKSSTDSCTIELILVSRTWFNWEC